MELALRPSSVCHAVGHGRSHSTTRVNRFMAAGVAMVGASLIAVNPLAPNVASDVEHLIEHRAVELTSGLGDVVGDYESVFSQAGANLQTLSGEAGVALPRLLQQIGTNLSGESGLISNALLGAQTGLQNALYGGWYGGDDGFVFGLFGGSVTHAGVTESGSTLQQILGALGHGDAFSAFSFYDEWALEALDHTMKPLLSPILSTAKAGATPTPTLPNEFLQSLTNLTNTFMTYANLKSLTDTLLSPELGVTFGLLGGLSKIGGDVSTGNLGGALTDVLKMPADLAGDLLNGYVYPSAVYNPTGEAFAGLLNNGGLLQQLLVTWPNQLATALGARATDSVNSAAAQSMSSLSGGLSQAASLLPNLANVVQPSLMLGTVGPSFASLLANITAGLSATLAPSLVSGLLLRLPSLLLALL